MIYQPLPCPELDSQWVLARRCSDRLEKMLGHIEVANIPLSARALDVGSYYGWFVNQFRRRGIRAEGVEKDNIAITIGNIAYNNINSWIHKNEGTRFLATNKEPYEIMICLSVMHHLVTQREKSDPLHLLKLLDANTTKVMFFEMGQEDEGWFAGPLSGWSVQAIENWVLNNSAFKTAVRLGPDGDRVGRFKDNFGRMLFAFMK